MTKSTPDYCHVDRKLPNYSVFNDYPTEEYRHSSCGTGTYLNWNPLLQNNATGSRICERPSVRRPRSWTPLPQRIPWMPRTMSTWTGGGAVLPCQRGGCGARGEDPRDVCSRNRGGNEHQFRHLPSPSPSPEAKLVIEDSQDNDNIDPIPPRGGGLFSTPSGPPAPGGSSPACHQPIQHHQPGQDMAVVEISGPNDDEWVTTNPPVYCIAAYLGMMKES